MTITPLKNNYFAIHPIPEDAWDLSFEESEMNDAWILTYKTKFRWEKYGNKNWNWEILFDEKPELIATSESISEEQAEQICPGKRSLYFENAIRPNHEDFRDNIYRDIPAIESFHSLLNSLNLSERVAILKKG